MVDRLGLGVRVRASFQIFALTAEGKCARWGGTCLVEYVPGEMSHSQLTIIVIIILIINIIIFNISLMHLPLESTQRVQTDAEADHAMYLVVMTFLLQE